MNTDIVIFDEPTIAQDWWGKTKIKNIVRDLVWLWKTDHNHYTRYGLCGRVFPKGDCA